MIIREEKGFSLVELMVSMVIFVFAIAAATGSFIPLVNQFKQQSKISETQIEGLIGLELLRQDIEHAGFGLPWNVTGVTDTDGDGILWDQLTGYVEADPPYNAYNDAPDNPPRAIVSDNNVGLPASGLGINGSDYLVIKSTNVGISGEAQKWTYVINELNPITGLYEPNINVWSNSEENLGSGCSCDPSVIVIKPQEGVVAERVLITDNNNYFTQFSQFSGETPNFAPFEPEETYIIYGVDPDTDLRMPFNRADYYITDPAAINANVPARCAPNTGVLVKSVINQGNGDRGGGLPLLDCVADMQVVYGLDMNENGTIGTYSDADGTNVADAPGKTEGAGAGTVQTTLGDPEELRSRLKEVRVYILAHEGQYDRYFTYTGGQTINIVANVESDPLFDNLGNTVDLSGAGANWQNYRWKVYTLVINPENLR